MSFAISSCFHFDYSFRLKNNRLTLPYVLKSLTITFTFFKPDIKKAGGEYIDITGVVKKIDELGGKEDEKALHKLSSCGCKIIATVHGEDMEDLKGKMGWENILKEKIFDRYIVLGRVRGIPTVLHIYDREFKRLSLC